MIDRAKEQELLRQRVLGWGLACEEMLPGVDLGRDIRLAPGVNGQDFQRVRQMDNLSQCLSIALTTALGDDVFNVSFGFDGLNALAEETNPVLVRERVRIGIIQILRKDPRVRRIIDVNFSGDGRLEGPPAGSRVLDVRVVFEAATGENVAIDIGKVQPNG